MEGGYVLPQPKPNDTQQDHIKPTQTKHRAAQVVERYEKIEALHKEMKQREKVDELYSGAAADGDEAKLDEAEEAAFQEVKKRVRTTAGGSTGSVRNLRIREDTAKYLLNLDVNSAYYDPKTRSMREDPQPNKAAHEKTFFGDNFVRTSGDYQAWQALNLHSMQSFDKGQDVHVQALPSYAEMLHNSFKAKKEVLGKKSAADVLDKYGSAGGGRAGCSGGQGCSFGGEGRSGEGRPSLLCVALTVGVGLTLACGAGGKLCGPCFASVGRNGWIDTAIGPPLTANPLTCRPCHRRPPAAKPEGEEAALLLGQTEHYVEYDRSGRVIKGQEAKARSRWGAVLARFGAGLLGGLPC